jgi:hypothetical protein
MLTHLGVLKRGTLRNQAATMAQSGHEIGTTTVAVTAVEDIEVQEATSEVPTIHPELDTKDLNQDPLMMTEIRTANPTTEATKGHNDD